MPSGPFLASRPVPDIECGRWRIGPGHRLLRDRGGRGKSQRLAGAGVEARGRGGRLSADAVSSVVRAEKVVVPRSTEGRISVRATGSDESSSTWIRRFEWTRRAPSHPRVRCAARGVLFPVDSVRRGERDLLESLGVPAYKLASGENHNLPFLRHVAPKGKPDESSRPHVRALRGGEGCRRGHDQPGACPWRSCSVLQLSRRSRRMSTSRAMETMREAFEPSWATSDHTLETKWRSAAGCHRGEHRGEHFTLDRSLPGP